MMSARMATSNAGLGRNRCIENLQPFAHAYVGARVTALWLSSVQPCRRRRLLDCPAVTPSVFADHDLADHLRQEVPKTPAQAVHVETGYPLQIGPLSIASKVGARDADVGEANGAAVKRPHDRRRQPPLKERGNDEI